LDLRVRAMRTGGREGGREEVMVSERDAGWGGRGAVLDEAQDGYCGLAAPSKQLVDPSRRPFPCPEQGND